MKGEILHIKTTTWRRLELASWAFLAVGWTVVVIKGMIEGDPVILQFIIAMSNALLAMKDYELYRHEVDA